MNKLLLILFLLTSTSTFAQKTKIKTKGPAATVAAQGQRWSAERANAWYRQHPWMSGANFTPSTAINQLEMWQAETFDPATIDKELGWAEGIGFNTMRVFLHSLAWQQDPQGFKKRVNDYLAMADKHHIQTILVFFDDCWNKDAKVGLQPAPKPGIHNSGWVQDPGDPASRDSATFVKLKPYVQDVLRTFANDKRVLLWDLYNEPGNSNKGISSMPLLRNVFAWAREVNPSQPLSVGLWNWGFKELNTFQALNSDVLTYHNYDEVPAHERVIELLKTHGRPMICTEYMARPRNSRFVNIMPLLKKNNIGAINWGLVDGKTNTKYQWDVPVADGGEPGEWFHEVFRKDGTPYHPDETDLIRKTNGK
ncbi:cellulase family glycosylhydrolase [Hymenobacter lutimineralis]|uniref:Cellulase family glycosylhydrolase n=1 Tax=Hymenobacter lutimineralis TaxID=2606448 RepID=A0A5D6V6Q6_9BACT|nr:MULTISPECIES: cellulase family glycosylhydrolase [Hymenobacter]QIX62854.1 cellulase family glycosylhydrolase [Hymenobacter sp. BT18]TYZ10990.1 cellulase family glycosylhydrolase [Hymenobacter lutimineralis]